MEDIVIIGHGGFAREVAFLIDDINKVSPKWKILGFVTKNKKDVGTMIGKYPIYCIDDDLLEMKVAAVIGIGNPKLLKEISDTVVDNNNISFPNLIHPSTIWDDDRIKLGIGNIICAGNILTTDIEIGSFNILNLNSTYGHDIVIGNYCVLNPGCQISGKVTIGSSCLIGAGSTILENLTIGNSVTVGAGAVVTKNINPNLTVIGVPAKPMNH